MSTVERAGADPLDFADEATAYLVNLMEEIRDLPNEQRPDALLWWARSRWWHPAGMIMTGWQGALHRDAYRVLERCLAADTPARRWNNSDWRVGRASIARLVGVEGHPAAIYATIPFRTWDDGAGRSWIAGAVGCMPMLDIDEVAAWNHLDISDVILWDPRTNDTRLVGEHRSQSVIIAPDAPDADPSGRLTVYADGAAFFADWARRRAGLGLRIRDKAEGRWTHPLVEPRDSGLPGALIVGPTGKARLPRDLAQTIVAGPGVTAGDLHAAAVRAANLPTIVGGGGARVH